MAADAAHRREDGQVLPALLLAVLAAGLMASMLFIVGRSGDQSARAGTASDAAALAAGTEAASALRGWLSGNPHHLLDLATGASPFGDYRARAEAYAQANGSAVTAADFTGFTGAGEWTFEVSVQAKDTVSDSASGAQPRARSTSRVAVSLTGLCPRGHAFGLRRSGRCLSVPLLDELCAPPPPPVPSPGPSVSPSVTPEPAPPRSPELDGLSCPTPGEIFAALGPHVRLIE